MGKVNSLKPSQTSLSREIDRFVSNVIKGSLAVDTSIFIDATTLDLAYDVLHNASIMLWRFGRDTCLQRNSEQAQTFFTLTSGNYKLQIILK